MSPSLNPVEVPGCITIPRGPNGSAGRRYLLTILQPDGTPQPMADAALVFEIANLFNNSSILKTYAIGTGIAFADLSTGIGVLTIPSGDFNDQTLWQDSLTFAWSLWITLPGDAASPYLQASGTIQIVDVA